jgi:hypothetical protein
MPSAALRSLWEDLLWEDLLEEVEEVEEVEELRER